MFTVFNSIFMKIDGDCILNRKKKIEYKITFLQKKH